MKRERTRFQGVYQRKSETRRNPLEGKPDVCFDITYKAEGRKIWEKVGWKSEGYTAQGASQVRIERMQAIRHGDLLQSPPAEPPRCKTFQEAWSIYKEKWLPNIARPDADVGRYHTHLQPRFADTPLNEIRPMDLENLKLDLTGKGLSPQTIKHVLSLLRRIYNKMVQWEFYDGRIPTASVKMPKVDNARTRFLTTDEADRLLMSLKGRSLDWWRMASISLGTGMRLGEILALIRSDIDLENGIVHVRDTKKGGSRMAHMTEYARAIFREMPPLSPPSLLFPTSNGTQRHSTEISKTFSLAVRDLGLNEGITDDRQKVVFHTLRHTFASWLAIEGVPLYNISKMMGHHSLQMTQRYAHLCPDANREAIKKLDLLVGRSHSKSMATSL